MSALKLEKDITQGVAEDFRQQLLELGQQAKTGAAIEVDWSGVSLIDSTGLAVLLTFAQQVERDALKSEVRFVGVQPQIHRLFQMVRIQQLLPVTIEEYRNAG